MKRAPIWIILAIAFAFRAILITKYPAGFNADEASFGYDAFSILNNFKDQWGQTLPLVLKSFGDYKSPLYSYLSTLPVLIFGLNVFAVRIAGVLLGTIAVYITYLLTKKLINKEWLALAASLMLAVNPWSIMLGRGAFESNLLTLFIPLFIYLFLIKKYSLSITVFGLTLFTYHSAKFIAPLIMSYLIYSYFKGNKAKKLKALIVPGAILIFFLSLFTLSFVKGGGSRIAERSITQGALIQGFDERMESIKNGQNPVTSKILHNKYTVIVKRFTNNYLQYYSPRFLIEKGAGEGSYGMIPGIGVINLFEIIALVGIIPLVSRNKNYIKMLTLLIAWLVIAPLPAALSTGIGFAGNRASGMMPVMQIIASMGLLGWYELLGKKYTTLKFPAITVFVIIAALNVLRFSFAYFRIHDNKVLRQSSFGYLDMATYAGKLSESRNIIISKSLSEPHIFILFANQMDPRIVQEASIEWDLKLHNVNWVDQLPEYKLGRFTVKSIDWKKDVLNGSVIVVGADEKIPAYIPVKTFHYPDGSPNIHIIDTNQKIYAAI
jgi:4-amino-4-deoxy-L-arabinose transferase-like glycosyltransferase